MNNKNYLLKISRLLLASCITIFVLLTTVPARTPTADFDGDGKADVAVFRPSDRYWYIKKSSGGNLFVQWGLASDNLAPADYDGDGKTDIAVHRKQIAFPETGTWYILKSRDFSFTARRWASNNVGESDIPVPADYDGDGKTDLAYYRISDVFGQQSAYFILQSLTNTGTNENWGNSSLGDRPVPADYDGDGKTDYAVYRNGVWFILQTSNAMLRVERFGLATDKVVPGDFDGDNKADIAVWRPSNGVWYVLSSRDGSIKYTSFGLSDDKPTPDDFDGDGKTDIAVFRPSNGVWYQQMSSSGFRAENFGLAGDIPIQNIYVR